MDRGYNSSVNRKTTMCKPMNKVSSRLTVTTSQDSRLLFKPRERKKKKKVQHTMHLQSPAADFWSLLHTAVFIGLYIHWCTAITAHFYHYLDPLSQLVYCHHCTLWSQTGSTFSFCTTYHYWTLLSTVSWCTANTVHLLSSLDPLSAGVLPSLHIAIVTAIHLSAALLTLWHTVSLTWIHY